MMKAAKSGESGSKGEETVRGQRGTSESNNRFTTSALYGNKLPPVVVLSSDDDTDEEDPKLLNQAEEECIAEADQEDADSSDKVPLRKSLSHIKIEKQRSDDEEDKAGERESVYAIYARGRLVEEKNGAQERDEDDSEQCSRLESDSDHCSEDEEENKTTRYPKRSKRGKYRVDVTGEKKVVVVDPKKRVFSHKKQNYCYSPAVFGLILDLPNAGLDLKELVNKFGKEDIEKHFDAASVQKQRHCIEQFHDFGNPQREKSVKLLLRNWNSKLYRNGSGCTKAPLVAAMHIVQGKRVDYPQFLSDTVHSRATNGSSHRVWCLCSAVMDFQNKKKGNCTPTADVSVSAKSHQQLELEPDVENARVLKDNELHKFVKPAEPYASTSAFSCKAEEHALGSSVSKKKDSSSHIGPEGKDKIELSLAFTLQQVKMVLSRERKVREEQASELKELEKKIKEREEEYVFLERNLQRFRDETRFLHQKLQTATDSVEKSDEDLGRLQKKHDDLVNKSLRRKRQEDEKGDLAKRHKREEEELVRDIQAAAGDLKVRLKNGSPSDPATPH